MEPYPKKLHPFVTKLLYVAIAVIFLGMPIAFSQGLPDRRDYGLVYAVLKSVGDLTEGQPDYRAANTESVRTHMNEKFSSFSGRDRSKLADFLEQLAEPGIIRTRHGGILEVGIVEDGRRLLLRMTKLPELACREALWGDVRKPTPFLSRTPTPWPLRGLQMLSLHSEPGFSASHLFIPAKRSFTDAERNALTVDQIVAICSASKSFTAEIEFRERRPVVTKAPWE
jgi:hypothetical protein